MDFLEELVRNPKKFGVPTIQEFARNPSKYRRAAEQSFKVVCDNLQPLKNVRGQRHYFQTTLEKNHFCGNDTSGLQKVEQIAKDHGMGLFDITMIPEIRETETTGYIIEITWWPKALLATKRALDDMRKAAKAENLI